MNPVLFEYSKNGTTTDFNPTGFKWTAGYMVKDFNFVSFGVEGSFDNELRAYTTIGTIDSIFLIEIFDDFLNQMPKNSTTIVILDNAPTHTSNLFQNNIEEWAKKGLILYFLPTYSPQLGLPLEGTIVLNMKYNWIQITDYASTLTLENYVYLVLANYGNGNMFEINFS